MKNMSVQFEPVCFLNHYRLKLLRFSRISRAKKKSSCSESSKYLNRLKSLVNPFLKYYSGDSISNNRPVKTLLSNYLSKWKTTKTYFMWENGPIWVIYLYKFSLHLVPWWHDWNVWIYYWNFSCVYWCKEMWGWYGKSVKS